MFLQKTVISSNSLLFSRQYYFCVHQIEINECLQEVKYILLGKLYGKSHIYWQQHVIKQIDRNMTRHNRCLELIIHFKIYHMACNIAFVLSRLYQNIITHAQFKIYFVYSYQTHNRLIFWNVTAHYHFQGYVDESLKLVSQQYRAWSYCKVALTEMALYNGKG